MTLRATLCEVSLATPSPQILTDFYRQALGYRFAEDGHGRIGTARDRRLRVVQGAAKGFDYAAYAVASADDLQALRDRTTGAGALLSESPWPGFAGPVLRVADPDGNLFLFGLPDSAGAGAVWEDPVASRAARIQHVVFASTDPRRLLEFYVKVLGFVLSDEVLDEKGVLRTAFVRCSHEHHSLAVFHAPTNRFDHHCLETSDWGLIRDWADHFAADHIRLQWGPGRHGPGNNLFIFVHDPDGNWVEISAELEIVASDRPVKIWPHEERTLNTWGKGLLRS